MKKILSIVLLLMLTLTVSAQFEGLVELRTKAGEYAKQKNYLQSIECYNQLIAEYQKLGLTDLVPKVKANNALNYLNVAIPYLESKKYAEAKPYLDLALENAGTDTKVLPMVQRYIGHWYSFQAQDIRISKNNLDKSIPLSLEAEKHYELGGNINALLREKSARASVMADQLRMNEAKNLYLQIIDRCEKDNSLRALLGQVLCDLGNVERKQEDYKSAIAHIEKGYDICIEENNMAYANIAADHLNNIYTYSIKDPERAKLWSKRKDEAKIERESSKDARVNSIQQDVKTYGNAVKLIVNGKDVQKGIDDLTALIERSESKTQYDPSALASYYSARGQGFLKLKAYEKTIQDTKKSIELLESAGENGLADLSGEWKQYAIAWYYIGDKKQTMEAAKKSIDIAEKVFGHTHSTTLGAYSMRSNFEGFYDMKLEALEDRAICFDIVQQNVERNFAYLTANERASYWNDNLPEITIMYAFAHKMNIKSERFTESLYNQQLLSKGILLSAENALKRTIDADPKYKDMYNNISTLRKSILDGKKSPSEISAIALEADRMERELTANVSGLSQFNRFIGVHADDVRQKLSNSDAAIEFIDYRVGKDSTMYGALVITKNTEFPLFLPLLEKKEVIKYKDNLATHLWGVIDSNLSKDIRNIYFAPSGLLYQIPIESQKTDDGIILGEKYNMYRLSSTRQLAINNHIASGEGAALYGNILYGATAEELHGGKNGTDRSTNRGASSIMEYTPLPATKIEIENISKILNSSKSMKPQLFMGAHATEKSFRNLSQTKTKLIHIATHGYFIENDKSATSLENCGLCFAGADFAADNEEEGSNGILTAGEASELELSSLDMLCLSACETGLGDVTSDGVFGLQRGFKKAGANSILMSLWKVDDDATCKLMTEFYSNWIGKKMTKHDALEAAKKTVRETKGWEDPKYWAAFILLDGLD